MAVNFSASGQRWRVWLVGGGLNEDVRHEKGLGRDACGLFFESAEGDSRLLLLAAAQRDALGDLAKLPNRELGQLVQQAVAWPRVTG